MASEEASPVGPESPERPPKLKRVSWSSLSPLEEEDPGSHLVPEDLGVSLQAKEPWGRGGGRWGLWPPW